MGDKRVYLHNQPKNDDTDQYSIEKLPQSREGPRGGSELKQGGGGGRSSTHPKKKDRKRENTIYSMHIKKRYDSRMNEFGIVSKRPSIQDAIRCDRRILGIGAQHGKNIDSCRYQSVRVIPV